MPGHGENHHEGPVDYTPNPFSHFIYAFRFRLLRPTRPTLGLLEDHLFL